MLKCFAIWFGLLTAVWAAPAFAQSNAPGKGPPTVPVVVTNPVTLNDEPARHPYSETSALNCPANSFACNVTFDDVPVGTRRVINHATCQLATRASVLIVPMATLHTGHNDFLPITSSIYNNTNQIAVINQMILQYLSPGFPDVRISFSVLSDTPDNISIICTLTGYDISLP